MKTKNKNRILIWTFFAIFLVVGFGLGKVEKANAGECTYNIVTRDGEKILSKRTTSSPAASEENCKANCKSMPGLYQDCSYSEPKSETERNEEVKKQAEKTGATVYPEDVTEKPKDICPEVGLTSPLKHWINCLLLYVLRFFGWLLSAAATLFIKMIDTTVFDQVLGKNTAIYELWGFVRDILNVAFILVLLFSAFCTVFQVSKFSYKNILLTLIIMALLVNFSFPISRVIIDFSNVIMYYFINGLGIEQGTKIFAEFGKNSDIGKIIYGSTASGSDTTYLLCAIVFVFIFAVTLLMIGVLLLIRIVALAILVIFSSVAFVGAVVPFLSTQASKWWTALFNYCFFGPIMIFMVVVASKMMSQVSNLKDGFGQVAKAQTAQDSSIIGAMAFFLIPIVILWIGISFAQSMSIAGAGAVVNKGMGLGKWIAKAPARGAWWGIKKTGVPGGIGQKYDQWKRSGILGSERVAQREAAIAGKGPFKVKGAAEKDMKRRAEEHKKNLTTEAELKTLASSGDAAAAFRLAEDKNMDQATYDAFVVNNKNSGLMGSVNAKVKQNRADITALNIANNPNSQEYKDTQTANPTWTPDQVKDDVVETAIGKLTAEKLADQDFVSLDKKMLAGPDKTRAINSTLVAIHGLAPSAKSELAKRLSPANRTAINKFAGSPPGPPII